MATRSVRIFFALCGSVGMVGFAISTAGGTAAAFGLPSVQVGCGSAYTTIAAGVAAASPGSTVLVCPGIYHEDVTVNKALTLTGLNATIDATGLANGVQVLASNVTVKGFTIENAIGEGVLVGVDSPGGLPPYPTSELVGGPVLTNEAIIGNNVSNDNKGFAGPGGTTSTCLYQGDCGGGIHLSVVSNSTVSGNHVSGNADGILLTDEYGPNFDNVISFNKVTDNITECGITLPSHNPGAVSYGAPPTFTITGLNPSVGGVYGNKVLFNVVTGNGTVPLPVVPGNPFLQGGGSGAGVGIFAPSPGTAAYDNLVEGNQISGNGLAGVTLHSHAPGQYLNGNQIIGNFIGQNNVDGDALNGVAGQSDPATTGVIVFSAVGALQVTIAGNVISNNADGVWIDSPPVNAGAPAVSNVFIGDGVKVLNF